MPEKIVPRKFFRDFLIHFKTRTGCLDLQECSEMNRPLLEYFSDLGEEKGFRVWLTEKRKRRKSKTQEYLIDLCWDVESEEGLWLEMAMEIELSEHSFDAIKYDFEKLTDIKAFLKVGIFAPYKKDYDRILPMCEDLISRHKIKVPEERYLVILLRPFKKHGGSNWYLEASGFLFDNKGIHQEIGTKRYFWGK